MYPKSSICWYVAAYGLIGLGFMLRLYQLDDIIIEKAEMTNIVWYIRKGLVAVLTENKALNNHPLTALSGYLTSALGYESLFALRWPAVVIGVITVAVVLRLARDWFGRRDGLLAGLLISLSAYHVTLSQQARGYAGLVGFTALAFFLAYRAVQTGQKRYWAGFVIASILNIYAHLYGVIAVAVISLIILELRLKQRLGRQAVGQAIRSAAAPLIVTLAVIYLAAFGLYLPMLADMVSVAGQTNQFRESDLRRAAGNTAIETVQAAVWESIRPFNLARDSDRLHLNDPTLQYGPFDRLAALAEGRFGFYFGLGTFLLGLIFSWPKFRQPVSICLVWLLLPFVIQVVGYFILPGAYFRGRFLAFIYIPYLLLMGRGWPGLADWLANHVSPRYPRLKSLAGGLGWLGIGGLVWLNSVWLITFYSAARQEGWGEIAAHIRQNLQPNDLIYCGQRANTPCDFDLSVRTGQDVRELDDQFVAFDEIQAKRIQFEQPGRVWQVMPNLTQSQIAALLDQVPSDHLWLLGNPPYNQNGWLLLDQGGAALADNLTAALQLGAALSLNTDEQYKNLISLAQVYLARNQLVEAQTTFEAAARLEPFPGKAGSWQQQKLKTTAEQLAYLQQAAELELNLPSQAVRIDKNYGGLARLVAYQLNRHTIAPGQPIRVDLYWQPLTNIRRNLVSYLYITDLQANLLGEARAIPGDGQLPTTSWQPGQLVVDTYTFPLEPALPTPLAARVEAGLFDPDTFEFIKPIDAAGRETDPTLAKLKILSATQPAINPANKQTVNFAGLIALQGYDFRPEPPGVVFYWQAQAEMDEDYTLFVHLLDEAGQLVGQMDGQPFQGNYPTSWWSPGESIVDHRAVPALPPGHYRLLVGWYRAEDGTRLSLADGSDDSLALGTIAIP